MCASADTEITHCHQTHYVLSSLDVISFHNLSVLARILAPAHPSENLLLILQDSAQVPFCGLFVVGGGF